jgi:hypothetical protein
MAEEKKLFKVTIDNITIDVEPVQLYCRLHEKLVVM